MSHFATFGSQSFMAMDTDYYNSPSQPWNDFDFQQATYDNHSSHTASMAGMRRAAYSTQQHGMSVTVDRYMHETVDTFPYRTEITYEDAHYLQPTQINEVTYRHSDIRLTSPASSVHFYTDRDDSESISSGTRAYSTSAGDDPNSPRVSPYYNTVKHLHWNTAGDMPSMPVSSPQVSHMGSHFVNPLQVEHIPASQEHELSELDAEGEEDPDASTIEAALPYRSPEQNFELESGINGSSEDEEMSDPNDADFNPSGKRRRKSSNNRRASPTTTTTTTRAGRSVRKPSSFTTMAEPSEQSSSRGRVNKSRPSKRTSQPSTPTPSRPFCCPLMPYGCTATFPSKNEWKRHVSTQHVKLGYWRCELCPPSEGNGTTAGSYNDFNRKDLFMQHLKRMHAHDLANSAPYTAIAAHAAAEGPVQLVETLDRNNHKYNIPAVVLDTLLQRCWVVIRALPARCRCPVATCDVPVFQGENAWDDRMEHLAGHFEKTKRPGSNAARVLDVHSWREDTELTGWLLAEGLIDALPGAGWRIGDGRPRREVIV